MANKIVSDLNRFKEESEQLLEKNPQQAAALAIKYSEALYRLEVIRLLRFFKRTAPLTADEAEIKKHFSRIRRYIMFITEDRKLNKCSDPDRQKERETALASFCDLFVELHGKVEKTVYSGTSQYKEMLAGGLDALFIAWMVYRDTNIKLPRYKEEAAA